MDIIKFLNCIELDELAEFATILGGFGTLLAAIVAIMAIWQANSLNKESSQPYIAPFMESSSTLPDFIELGIMNYGKTAAKNIKISISPEPRVSKWSESESIVHFDYPEEMGSLVPGQEWRTIWDKSATREECDLPSKYTMEISYIGIGKKAISESFVLDWKPFEVRSYLDEKGIHHIAKEANNINRTLKEIKRSICSTKR